MKEVVMFEWNVFFHRSEEGEVEVMQVAANSLVDATRVAKQVAIKHGLTIIGVTPEIVLSSKEKK